MYRTFEDTQLREEIELNEPITDWRKLNITCNHKKVFYYAMVIFKSALDNLETGLDSCKLSSIAGAFEFPNPDAEHKYVRRAVDMLDDGGILKHQKYHVEEGKWNSAGERETERKLTNKGLKVYLNLRDSWALDDFMYKRLRDRLSSEKDILPHLNMLIGN